MAGEWQEVTFAQLVGGDHNVIGGPFGSNLTSSDYANAGVPIVRGSNMSQLGRYVGGDFAYVSTAKARELANNQVAPGDIVVTQRGTLGQVSILPDGIFRTFIVSQSQMGVRAGSADAFYVYYLLSSPEFTEFLDGYTVQTGVPHINLKMLREWRVRVPPRPVQEGISHVLGALDDKIELNRRMAETLEATARVLFKSWFVDFDPVRAKAEGHPTGLPDTLAALFPARLTDDGLPEGWATSTIGAMFDVAAGNTPSTTEPRFWNGQHAWATPKDLSSLATPVLQGTERRLTDAGLARVSSGLLPEGTLLLSSRAPIGYMAFATEPTSINQGFAGFVRRDVTTSYAWLWCEANMELIRGNASGSTFPEISKSVLRGLPMLTPARTATDAFALTVDPLIERLVALNHHSRTLATVRDALLPKLISGELRIRDAERAAAAA